MEPTAKDTGAMQRREDGEREAFNRLKAELDQAFAAPDATYRSLTAAEVIARNRTRPD